MNTQVLVKRVEDAAITAGGFVVGRLAIGYGDDMLKPKEGDKPGFVSKYGASAVVTGAGLAVLTTQENPTALKFGAGVTAAGIVSIAGKAMGDADPNAGKTSKMFRAALGEPAPSASQPQHDFTFTVTEESDTAALPAAGTESDYDQEPASAEHESAAVGATSEPEDEGLGY